MTEENRVTYFRYSRKEMRTEDFLTHKTDLQNIKKRNLPENELQTTDMTRDINIRTSDEH